MYTKDYFSQLNARTRTVMARVAELSMMKCKLLDSEHERTKLQEQLEDAYVRLEKGLAPTIEAQAEWKRYLDKQVDKEMQQQRVTELTEGKGRNRILAVFILVIVLRPFKKACILLVARVT